MARKGKYGTKIVNEICDLIRQDTFTITEICVIVGINQDTYYDWLKNKPEFSEKISAAHAEQKHFFLAEAKKSMLKLIQGYEFEEEKTILGQAKKGKKTSASKGELKKVERVKKHIPPDSRMVIFALTNTDPDKWKNKQTSEVTGAGGKDLIPSADYSKLSKKDLALLHSLHEKAKPSET